MTKTVKVEIDIDLDDILYFISISSNRERQKMCWALRVESDSLKNMGFFELERQLNNMSIIQYDFVKKIINNINNIPIQEAAIALAL
jgi:hypothetical protein